MSVIGANQQLPVDAISSFTGSISAIGTLLGPIDTSGYNTISVQLTGVWEGSVIFQASNDNTNWVNVQGYAYNSTMSAIDTADDNDIYILPVIGRYFRAITSVSTTIGFTGTVNAVAYLRQQSLSGIGEASLTQAMDDATGVTLKTAFPGFVAPGQQAAVNSMPVALPNEQILDKHIVGRQFVGNITLGTNLCLDPALSTNGFSQPLDCLQYRSVSVQVFQSASATAGALTFEASNDGITFTSYPLYASVPTTYGAQSTGYTFSLTGGATSFYEGPLYFRYLRVRVSTAVTATGLTQVITRLSMAPYTKYTQAVVNVGQFGSNGIPGGTSMTSATTMGNSFPIQSIGGNDRSVTRSELIGAPYNNLTSYTNGPYARLAYFDLAGAIGVAGPQPFLAEDKTYPVNVRLERSTNGQDSVQDLLQQILIELRANNHYTRETPVAVAQLLQSASLFMPSSMNDDPENFASDARTDLNVRGH